MLSSSIYMYENHFWSIIFCPLYLCSEDLNNFLYFIFHKYQRLSDLLLIYSFQSYSSFHLIFLYIVHIVLFTYNHTVVRSFCCPLRTPIWSIILIWIWNVTAKSINNKIYMHSNHLSISSFLFFFYYLHSHWSILNYDDQ